MFFALVRLRPYIIRPKDFPLPGPPLQAANSDEAFNPDERRKAGTIEYFWTMQRGGGGGGEGVE